MKDSLFELLLNFFDKDLSQQEENEKASAVENGNGQEEPDFYTTATLESQTLTVRAANANTTRIFTDDEKMKFTKGSYQFLMRLVRWGIIAPETLELIITQLLFSESRFVNLQETKWTIRNTLAENLDSAQLAFLDLVLYQKEDQLSLH